MPSDEVPSLFRKSVAGHFSELQGALALDAGCGGGRNARFLRDLGIDVVCADRAAEVIRTFEESGHGDDIVRSEKGRLIPVVADLAPGRWPFRPKTFALVLAVHFLDIALIDVFAAALMKGGMLVLETIGAQGGNAVELPERVDLQMALARHFDVVIYRDRRAGPNGCKAASARVLGVKLRVPRR